MFCGTIGGITPRNLPGGRRVGNETTFTGRDREQLRRHGIEPAEAERHLELIRRGTAGVRLVRPATVGDGILVLDEREIERLCTVYDEARAGGRAMKFVPASGAATRMFRDLYRLLESEAENTTRKDPSLEHVAAVLTRRLAQFAFYDELAAAMARDGIDVERCRRKGDAATIARYILSPEGLGYGGAPKGLVKFHRYRGEARTAFEEHLVETALYTIDRSGRGRIHFTASPAYLDRIEDHLRRRATKMKEDGIELVIDLSTQNPSTDTVAAAPDGTPARGKDGRLLLRPSGHGALLDNLRSSRGDIVFIKNIDNVAPDRLKAVTSRYMRALGGLLVETERRVGALLERLERSDGPEATRAAAEEALSFCRETFGRDGGGRGRGSDEGAVRAARIHLARPIRVCGMVRSEGEPGGGPFWISEPTGGVTLQIVEEAEVRRDEPEQAALWRSATHFNPVELVCALRDHRGEPYDLRRFVEPGRYIVTEKYYDGHPVRVLERPGLWNGSMHHWNTVFVEVPPETFTPVKRFEDLLRDVHTA